MLNGVFNLATPEEAAMMDYAADIALVVVTKYLKDAELHSWGAASAVKAWLGSIEGIRIESHIITPKLAIKYLEVIISAKHSFKQHLYACEKAYAMSIARMTSSVAKLQQICRLLLTRVVSFILQYAFLIRETAYVLCNANNPSAVYRRIVLTVCSAFRTVLDDGAFVIWGMLPIDILADDVANISNVESIFKSEKYGGDLLVDHNLDGITQKWLKM